MTAEPHRATAGVNLYWIPLGAGERVVRFSGRVFEALSAAAARRPRCDLYHSALTIDLPDGPVVIEMAPVVNLTGDDRGVVAEGPVGTKVAGRFRVFRYEIRCWHGGVIPDLDQAVSAVHLPVEVDVARDLLDKVRSVPTPVWGRDELGTGEMWNSNSVTSWLLAVGGFDTALLAPPTNGRAPGWAAGLAVAARGSADTS